MEKSCGDCTKCCEGWLVGNIRGKKMSPGNPCPFVKKNKGCGIYPSRPKNPCKVFQCGWLAIENMPDEFKPSNSGVIMAFSKKDDITYLAIVKAPNNPTAEFLSWAILYATNIGENILWYIDDKSWWIGSDLFCKKMEEMHNVR